MSPLPPCIHLLCHCHSFSSPLQPPTLDPLFCPQYTQLSIQPYMHRLSLGTDPLGALCESRPHPVERTPFCLVASPRSAGGLATLLNLHKHHSAPKHALTLCTLCALLIQDVMDLLCHLNIKKLPQVTDFVHACVCDAFNHPCNTERAFLPFFSTNYHHWQWWILILTRWLLCNDVPYAGTVGRLACESRK